MSATFTATPAATFAASIRHDYRELCVRVMTATRGERLLSIDLESFDRTPNVTDAEQTVLYLMLDGPARESYSREVSLTDLQTLAGLAVKVKAAPAAIEIPEPATAAVEIVNVPEIVPAAVPAPVVPVAFATANGLADAMAETNASMKVQRAVRRNRRKAEDVDHHGLDQVAETIRSLQSDIRYWSQVFYTVQYDIPDRVSKHSDWVKQVPNPSGWFRRIALKDTDSAWLFPESVINLPAMQAWIARSRRLGCKIRVRPFDRAANDGLKTDATEELRKFLTEVHTSLIKLIGQADDNLRTVREDMEKRTEPASDKERRKVESDRHDDVRKYIRKAATDLQTAIEAAERYDLREDTRDLEDGLKAAIRAARADFNDAARRAGVKLSDVRV